MNRRVTVLGAPSSIGIRPYDDGGMRCLDQAPGVLRQEGLVERLGARDMGDVVAPRYRDFERPQGRPRNEAEVAEYSRALAAQVAAAAAADAFVLVLGGDCSIVLGCLLGLRHATGARIGLAYVDAHADFATPQESWTGSAASMCLAQAIGRGDTPLARLADEPLVRAGDVVLLGRSDENEDGRYGESALRALPVLDLPREEVRELGAARSAAAALERLAHPGVDGYWIHVDADVIDPQVVPAVDSPEAGGFSLEELESLLKPLVDHPGAIGLELTIYDPALDPDRTSAARLVALLERIMQ